MKKQPLGTMISLMRKEKGMTQLELAEKMGVTDKAVSKWERNLSCPDINAIPKLAEILDVSVDELIQAKRDLSEKKSVKQIIQIAIKGVGLAMGVAVCVLSILKEISTEDAIKMLGLGLACVAISLFNKE